MADRHVRVALVLIGNELLSGKIVDQNGPLVMETLRRVGAELVEVRTIPDDTSRIAEAVFELSERYDVVMTSGGVGPTHDDVTVAAVACAFGLPLVEESVLLERIRGVFGSSGEESRVWSRMARVPSGCELVADACLPWPVYRVRNVYMLPGVPQIFRRQLLAICERFSSPPVKTGVLYLRLDEGRIAEPLADAVVLHPGVEFGSYPVMRNPDYRTRVTAESRSDAALAAAIAWLTERFGEAVHAVETEGIRGS